MSIELAFSYSHVFKKKKSSQKTILSLPIFFFFKLTYLLTAFWVIRNESKPRF